MTSFRTSRILLRRLVNSTRSTSRLSFFQRLSGANGLFRRCDSLLQLCADCLQLVVGLRHDSFYCLTLLFSGLGRNKHNPSQNKSAGGHGIPRSAATGFRPHRFRSSEYGHITDGWCGPHVQCIAAVTLPVQLTSQDTSGFGATPSGSVKRHSVSADRSMIDASLTSGRILSVRFS